MGGVAGDSAAWGSAVGDSAAWGSGGWAVVVACAVFGAFIGWAGRLLLGKLARGAKIRAGVLEVATAGVIMATGLVLWPSVLILPGLWAAVLLVVLSAVDLKHHRLPDAITLPAVPITALVLMMTWFLNPLSGSLLRALIAALIVGAIFFGIATLAPAAMGRGDAKLVLSLGLVLGYLSWPAVIIGIALAFVLGGLAGVVGMIAGRMKLTSALPFGPFLLVGTWIMVLWPDLPRFLAG